MQTHHHLPEPQIGCADLCDETATFGLVQDAWNRMDGIDVLVTSVGIAKDGPLLLLNAADISECMQRNLRPVINACEAMCALAQGRSVGRIINVSSITGLVGQPMRVAYGAAKGAVISYTKSLARKVAAHGITANVIAPQVVEGGVADLMKARVRDTLLANTPVGRACTANDIAHGVAYLASPAASFVTGTVLNVTGGLVTW
jgi:NAD(P)-dependent dehydrogenase (short-subunit alcohol dehydrogenase family)